MIGNIRHYSTTFGTTKKSLFPSGEFFNIFSLIFSLVILSSLNLNVVSAIEVNGSTLSVFNSFNYSINSNIEFISVASFSAFFSSSEILANFDMCFTVLRSIVIW